MRVSERRAGLAGRATRLNLSLLVELSDVLRVRKAIVSLAHPALEILTVTPAPHDSRVRVTIGLDSGIAAERMNRIMSALRSGEFGVLRAAPAVSVPHDRDRS